MIGVETAEPDQMVLPVGRTTHITLLSNDVIHGFYVPTFNFSRYALPGHRQPVRPEPDQPGTYRGQCTQICGLYHSSCSSA